MAHLPVVLASSGRVHAEATDYLRDRGLGRWSQASSRRPSANSVRAYAQDLVNFLEFCEWIRVDWRHIERGHDADHASLIGYASHMANGTWSKAGEGLNPVTIARRPDVAQDFLAYAADSARGWRSPFRPTVIQGFGRRRADAQHMTLPRRQDVDAWLDEIESRSSRANYLMARLIFEGGLRREEVVSIHAGTLPSPAKFDLSDVYQFITIQHGTKGQRDPSDPAKVGKARVVRLRNDFVELLHAYRTAPRWRPAAVRRFLEQNPGKLAPKELFLNPKTGAPFAVGHLNEVFDLACPKNRQTEKWSPHIGRHCYACWTLLEFTRETAELTGAESGFLVSGGAEILARGALGRLQAHLGHESDRTTDLYVRWVDDQMRLQNGGGL